MNFRPEYDRHTKKFPETKKPKWRSILDSSVMLVFIFLILRLVLVQQGIYIGGRIIIIDDMMEWIVTASENLLATLK